MCIGDGLATLRTCSECGVILNIEFVPSEVDGICGAFGGDIVQRDDEPQQAIDKRLKVYEEQTAPLVDYYRKEGSLLSVETSDFEPVFTALQAVAYTHLPAHETPEPLACRLPLGQRNQSLTPLFKGKTRSRWTSQRLSSCLYSHRESGALHTTYLTP